MQASTMLIVGGGQAGGCAAAALRQQGYTGRIILVGAEAHRPYERPPLSKAVLNDESAEASVFLHKQEFHEGLDLDWRPGVRIAALDPGSRVATTVEGASIGFDRCLLATGGRPRPLPGLEADAPNVYYLRDLDDARLLRRRMTAGTRVTVIGAGFLGLEFASIAREKGMAVTVLEAGAQVLGRAVPALFADWLLRQYEQAGIRIQRGVRLRSVQPKAAGVTVGLEDGQELESDLLLVAIGQLPSIELAQQAGLALDDGIAVDARCETSAPGIFAAGDCASHFNPFLGKRVRLESWQNAQEQGIVAAKSMLGLSADYDVLPWFWSDQLGLNIQMLGIPDPAYRYVVRGEPASARFCVLGFDRNRPRYALAVNSGGDVAALRKLFQSKAEIDSDVLTDAARTIRDIVKTAI